MLNSRVRYSYITRSRESSRLFWLATRAGTYSLISLLSLLFECASRETPDCTTPYRGMTLCFGTTVGQATQQHQLGYKPPGYYYKQLADSTTMNIEYDYHSGDFDDESQPATELYDRVVNTYLFRFTDQPGRFGKELASLEASLGIEMVILEQNTYSTNSSSAVDETTLEGQYTLAKGWTETGVVIYLRERPSQSGAKQSSLLILFYKGTDLGKIDKRVYTMQ